MLGLSCSLLRGGGARTDRTWCGRDIIWWCVLGGWTRVWWRGTGVDGGRDGRGRWVLRQEGFWQPCCPSVIVFVCFSRFIISVEMDFFKVGCHLPGVLAFPSEAIPKKGFPFFPIILLRRRYNFGHKRGHLANWGLVMAWMSLWRAVTRCFLFGTGDHLHTSICWTAWDPNRCCHQQWQQWWPCFQPMLVKSYWSQSNVKSLLAISMISCLVRHIFHMSEYVLDCKRCLQQVLMSQGNGECVGIAFQSMNADEAENIGYVIPSLVVTHFLSLGSQEIERESVSGFGVWNTNVIKNWNAHDCGQKSNVIVRNKTEPCLGKTCWSMGSTLAFPLWALKHRRWSGLVELVTKRTNFERETTNYPFLFIHPFLPTLIQETKG